MLMTPLKLLFKPWSAKRVEEKLDTHAESIKKGCERDIRLVDNRLRTIEKKMWTIAGSIAVISVIVSPIGQRILRQTLQVQTPPAIVK